MEEVINSLLDLRVIGTIAAFVFVTVQGLKVFKFVTDEASIAKAAVTTGLVGGVGFAVGELYPPAAPYVTLAFQLFISTMVAGLGYKYLVGPILEKFGIPVSTKDLK